MKKGVSILLIFIILATGMHPFLSAHLCSGQVAAIKVSFSGEKATCGMPQEAPPDSLGPSIQSDCCKDVLAEFSLPSKFVVPEFDYLKIFQGFLIFFFSSDRVISPITSSGEIMAFSSPPESILKTCINLAFLCVLRR